MRCNQLLELDSEELRRFKRQARYIWQEVGDLDEARPDKERFACRRNKLGKPAGIFLPSGTMCNVIAYKAQVEMPGDYIILDETSHPLETVKNETFYKKKYTVHTCLGEKRRLVGAFDAEQEALQSCKRKK